MISSLFATVALSGVLTAQLTPSTGSEAAEDLSRRITPEVLVAQKARPAVVFIRAEVSQVTRDFFGNAYQQRGESTGSGVVIYEDGWVVTNYHDVKNAENIRVSFDTDLEDEPETYAARLVNAAEDEDLALLRIEAPAEHRFATVPLGTSDDLMIAEPVIAIGNPFGQSFTVSRGIISGLHRNIQTAQGVKFSNLIQTDASINLGNSGGPLLNINGRLIGINAAMNTQAENIGFAIPVDRVRQVLEETLLAPSRAASWYGFEVSDQPVDDAFPVVSVVAGGPAASAGVKVGDTLLGWGGKRFVSSEAYRFARAELEPGVPTNFEFRRKGSIDRVVLTGWRRDDGLLYERAGFRAEIAVVTNYNSRKWFARVAEVRPDGPAAHLGLEVDDLIESFRAAGRQTFVPQRTELLALYLSPLEKGSEVEVDVWRDENGNQRLDYTEQLSGAAARHPRARLEPGRSPTIRGRTPRPRASRWNVRDGS
ncbi:MAG: trypsin-like peptidase domain-containing protein [Planctomycetota bacterium]